LSTKKLQIIGSIGGNVELDDTLLEAGKAADAKAVGDKFADLVGDEAVSEQINNAVAQKSQVQIITWEDDD
jgi:hypothetical protein